jgi:NADH-quinone oxidoreductase subunit I/NAD(P)H-quinone oxidoreductase subunit I
MPESAAEYVNNITDTVRSFWHGMSITMSYLFRRPTTIQYPDRTELPVADSLPPRYRGFLEVDMAICTGCQACERACPINCIQITLDKDVENPKQRVMTQFDIDEAKCMYCGLCVEPCPTGAIQHTREFEGSVRSVRNLTFRWVSDPNRPVPVYKPPKGAEYFPRAPLGELVRELVRSRAWDQPGTQFLPPEAALQKAGGKTAAKKKEGADFSMAIELAKKVIGRAGDTAFATKVLEEGMANTDCGDCDWPTCFEYSEALATGKDQNPHKCAPGGAESHAAAEAILYAFKKQKLPDTVLGGKSLQGAPDAGGEVAAEGSAEPAAAPAGGGEEISTAIRQPTTDWPNGELVIAPPDAKPPGYDAIYDALAQTDCGDCEYDDCDGYAKALAAGEQRELQRCIPGGEDTRLQLERLYGLRKPKQ